MKQIKAASITALIFLLAIAAMFYKPLALVLVLFGIAGLTGCVVFVVYLVILDMLGD